jgi:hypothetical protein
METPAPEKKSWFARHKIITLAIVLLAAVAGLAEYQQYQAAHPAHKAAIPQSETGKSGTAAQPKMTLSGSSVKVISPTLAQVSGNITNNQSDRHGATIEATFYDASGKQIAVAKGTIPPIAAKATVPYTLKSTADLTANAKMEVRVVAIN